MFESAWITISRHESMDALGDQSVLLSSLPEMWQLVGEFLLWIFQHVT
jgi:hypothetical protein